MEFPWINFLILTFFISGVIIFFLHRTLISSTEGAVKRLNDEIAKANAKQNELNQKIKEADDELTKRKEEAKQLAQKMRSDAEEETKQQREKIISSARKEGEEIIAKAQHATEKMRIELEKEIDIKGINFGSQLLNQVLSQKAKGVLDEILINEFLDSFKNVDMNRIGPDIKTAEIITVNPLSENFQSQLTQVIKQKLNREIVLQSKTDPKIGGGVIVKFGSMALDGSIQNLIRESGIKLKEAVQAK